MSLAAPLVLEKIYLWPVLPINCDLPFINAESNKNSGDAANELKALRSADTVLPDGTFRGNGLSLLFQNSSVSILFHKSMHYSLEIRKFNFLDYS